MLKKTKKLIETKDQQIKELTEKHFRTFEIIFDLPKGSLMQIPKDYEKAVEDYIAKIKQSSIGLAEENKILKAEIAKLKGKTTTKPKKTVK